MSKIGIIGAMELEVEALKSTMDIEKTVTKAGMTFCEGKLNGANVVVVRSGIGKVNAALCVQILADIFEVTHVINTGVAGSLNAALDIGDILISRIALHHDMDATNFGYPLGEVPQMGITEFPADQHLIELSALTMAEVLPELHSVVGRVVSGDQFIAEKSVKERLIREFRGDCCEMEGAAIAHGCYLNNIPFVILRAISDKADDSAHMDYPTFECKAADHCAKLVTALVAKIK
jgi:adenosylhomocysteine nucleosidase